MLILNLSIIFSIIPLTIVSYHQPSFTNAFSRINRIRKVFSSVSSYTPFNGYNGTRLDQYYSKRPFEVWERLVDIGSPILGWWIAERFDNVTSKFRSDAENRIRVNLRAAELKDAIVQGKSVTFIKSGQALALRPDIVKSPEYIRELQKLQDEVGTFDNKLAMDIIKEDFGIDASKVYEFDPVYPIASASIGQVYRARLKSNPNQYVAVKVQRPDAIAQAPLDMYILRQIARIVKKVRKLRSDLVGIIDEFGYQIYNELNYTQEAANCERFKRLYGDIPGIYIPNVYRTLTSRRVLTMEFVDGVKGPWSSGGERLLTVGLQCSVLQLLGTGFFHSDPHRGNLLQTKNGELCYLDFGMMTEVPAFKRYALIGTILGLVNKDFTMVINNMKNLDFFPPDSNTDLAVTKINEALLNATENGRASTLNFTKLNQNLEGISEILPFQLPPYYIMIVRSLTILEGLALFVDPDFKLVKGAYPFVARQILNEPTPELNNLLKSLLISKDTGRIRWNKLEQFISISSNANAAMAGNFSALKSAQDRSDIVQSLQNTRSDAVESTFSLDITRQIMDYLLSTNGQFLRDALVTDIVDTIEALGLTSLTVLSLITNRLIPEPREKPNREIVYQFFRLIQMLINNFNNPSTNNHRNGGSTRESSIILSNQRVDPSIVKVLQSGLVQINQLTTSIRDRSPEAIKFQDILLKFSVLIGDILERLMERNTKRLVRNVFNPKNIENTLPVLSRALDLLPRI